MLSNMHVKSTTKSSVKVEYKLLVVDISLPSSPPYPHPMSTNSTLAPDSGVLKNSG